MKRYGQIYDKICTMENLYAAHENARKDKLFYREVQMVDADPEYYLGMIQEMLLNENYQLSMIKGKIGNLQNFRISLTE